MSMIKSIHVDPIKFHGITQHENPARNTNSLHHRFSQYKIVMESLNMTLQEQFTHC